MELNMEVKLTNRAEECICEGCNNTKARSLENITFMLIVKRLTLTKKVHSKESRDKLKTDMFYF